MRNIYEEKPKSFIEKMLDFYFFDVLISFNYLKSLSDKDIINIQKSNYLKDIIIEESPEFKKITFYNENENRIIENEVIVKKRSIFGDRNELIGYCDGKPLYREKSKKTYEESIPFLRAIECQYKTHNGKDKVLLPYNLYFLWIFLWVCIYITYFVKLLFG